MPAASAMTGSPPADAHLARQRRLRQALGAQRDRLLRIARSRCRDPVAADDLVQEALVRALTHVASLREEARLEIWVTRILVNLLHDQHRRLAPVFADARDIPCPGDSPERAIERDDLIRQTRAAIGRLGKGQRQVITLVELSDLSYADTARALDLPVGTVMSRLWRARRNLRRALTRQWSPPVNIAESGPGV